MNYPAWDVAHIGSGWVIGIIAIFHVLISHFAVGGGLYLPIAERKALKEGRREWLNLLRKHSRFFLILTGVFGAVSGVGIWFAIGLANPEATSALIHNFVFAWAAEWVFFLVELSCAAVYYYTWDRVSPRLHLAVGWLYAAASLATLIIINGILTFMLTPGEAWLSAAGTGREASQFWPAFFNPVYWPSLFLRILVCLNLAGVWALASYSKIAKASDGLRAETLRWSARWIAPGFLLLPVFLAWFLWSLPEPRRALLELGVHTIGPGAFTQATRAALVVLVASAGVAGLVYLFAWKSPRDFGFSHAAAVLALAAAATGAGEYTRELLRKPYVVVRYMYSNGVRVQDAARFNREGFLTRSLWAAGAASLEKRGEAMFRGQCMACHTRKGYRSMRRLLAGRNEESIGNLLRTLHEHKEDSPYRAFMPPLVGTEEEIAALKTYLAKLAAPSGGEEKSAVVKQIASQ